MASQAGAKLVETIKKYRNALKYLDTCGELTFEKLQKAHDIAGVDVPVSQLRADWDLADGVLAREGQPGGKEYHRFQMKRSLQEAITTFEDTARKMGVSEAELKGGGCFVATTCYGNPLAPEVLLLQSLRDEYLCRSVLGRLFVWSYNRFSPHLSAILGRHRRARSVVTQVVLRPVVAIVRALRRPPNKGMQRTRK